MTRLIASLALLLGVATSAFAAEDDFYKGKQINLIIGSGPSGIYDVYGRLMAAHWADHIPGKPTIVVQNMEGASGLKAAQFMATVAPKDGLTIASSLSAVPTMPLFIPEAKFDANKLGWIGSITKDPFVGYVWTSTSPIKTYEEGKTKEAIMGGNSLGAAGVDMAVLSNAMFGTKFKIVVGYKDSTEVKLALERGEIHGAFANAWGDLKTQQPEWLRDKKVTLIIQHGFQRHPDLPDVPLLVDQAKTDSDRQALEVMLARQEFSKPYFTPPDVPPARLQILRRAFDETMKDPKFLEDVAKSRLVVDQPMKGEDVAAIVARLSKTSPDVIKRITDIFAAFAGANKK
jgi:tripartite-type tricarboxylate transporter receptor subunit TctC